MSAKGPTAEHDDEKPRRSAQRGDGQSLRLALKRSGRVTEPGCPLGGQRNNDAKNTNSPKASDPQSRWPTDHTDRHGNETSACIFGTTLLCDAESTAVLQPYPAVAAGDHRACDACIGGSATMPASHALGWGPFLRVSSRPPRINLPWVRTFRVFRVFRGSPGCGSGMRIGADSSDSRAPRFEFRISVLDFD